MPKSLHSLKRLVTMLAALLPTSLMFAQGGSTPLPASPFDGPSFSLSAAATREAAAQVTAEKLSDATILFEETAYRISAADRLTYTRRLVVRMETQAGVNDWAEASMDWDPWYQNASKIHARVLTPSGSFTELDQKTVTDAAIGSTGEESYTSARVRKAPLPAMAVGAIVEEVFEVEEKRPYFAGGSVYRYAFTNGSPTERERLIVELPAAIPFHENVADLPQLTVTRSEHDGMREVIYEQGRRSATVYGDIDLISSPGPLPMVEFSTGKSWESVAKEYAALSEPAVIADQVRSLLPTSGGASRLATIQILVQRLHREVRYTGIEFDEAQLTPRPPSEVLKRHYGDCKDKATLLVTMLRAAGIPAHVALLSSGTGRDVTPELPGMNRFNHAIVYVPAAGAEAALWIDATAEFHEVGTVPFEDAGRWALVVAPETTALARIPAATPADSVLVETRTFRLADLGASQVVESSDTHGAVDAVYRARYGGAANKKVTGDLDTYSKNTYLARSLAKVDHGDGTNLSQPFHLSLTMEGARRGFTSLVDAVVAIFPSGTFYELPSWITTAPKPLADDATADQKLERTREEAQRSPTYLLRPFVVEQRYRILVPAGFALRSLPTNRTTPLGLGSLTESYLQESPRVMTVTMRLSTGKAEITAQEALDFRQAVAAVYQREVIQIAFEQTGVKLMAQGKVKEALAADRDAIAASPQGALPHVRLARALLDAGVGDMARAEAARGVALDPASPAAWMTQGWVLQHDLLGERFGRGFDRAGAITSLRKAVALRNEDMDSRFDLAILYEFGAMGIRYSDTTDLPEAIALYRALIEEDQKKNSSDLAQHRINLGYALLYHGDFKDVEALFHDIPPGINRSTLAIAAAVAQKDVAAGIAAADALNVTVEERGKGLISAGSILAQLGLYAQASAILAAGIQGQQDAPTTARQVEIFRNLHRVPANLPVTTPESVVAAFLNQAMSGTATAASLRPLFSHHAYASEAAFERNIEKNLANSGVLRGLTRTSGFSETVLRDLIVGSMTLKTTGNDASGYGILAQTLGGGVSHYFVVKEEGAYRLVADEHDNTEAGHLALYALEAHQPALARSVLDWKRALLHRGGGDDALSGDLLPRFWTVDSPVPGANSPESMRLAAIALLAGSMDSKPYLPELLPLSRAVKGTREIDFYLLLATAYASSEQPEAGLPFVDELLKQEPTSTTALNLAMADYMVEGDTASWDKMLVPRLTRTPADPDLLRAKIRLLMAEHQYNQARATGEQLFATGQATSSDYNGYAWSGLFDGQLGPEITNAAQKSNMLSKNASFGDLHTLACVYAAQGKITEARQVLAQSIAAGNLSQPNSAIWYGLGLLYEDYGLRDAALTAYARVRAHEWDDHVFIEPSSTYLLAQKRIATLNQTAGVSQPH